MACAASLLVNLTTCEWRHQHGFGPAEQEHVYIHGLPVQFLPSTSPLADEAITEAVQHQVGEVSVPVIAPAYLVALALEHPTAKHIARAAWLVEEGVADDDEVRDLVQAHGLDPRGVV